MTEQINWQERELEAKTYIKDNPLYSQIVYISNDTDNCFPIPFHSLDSNSYPYVVERPTGIDNPKFNWKTLQWEELSSGSQASKLNKLANDIATLESKSNKENSELTKQLENLEKITSTNTEASAQIIQMLSAISAKINATEGGSNDE